MDNRIKLMDRIAIERAKQMPPLTAYERRLMARNAALAAAMVNLAAAMVNLIDAAQTVPGNMALDCAIAQAGNALTGEV